MDAVETPEAARPQAGSDPASSSSKKRRGKRGSRKHRDSRPGKGPSSLRSEKTPGTTDSRAKERSRKDRSKRRVPANGESQATPVSAPRTNVGNGAATSGSEEAPSAIPSVRTAKPRQHGKPGFRIGVGVTLFLVAAVTISVAAFLILVNLDSAGRGVKPRSFPPNSSTTVVAANNPTGAVAEKGKENQSPVTGADNQTTAGSNPVAVGTAADPGRPALPSFRPEPGKLRHFRETEAAKAWSNSIQGVLALEVAKGTAVRTFAGTIVDGKGWVLASYSAVAGARSVRARFAPAAPDETASTRDQGAEVVNFIAAWPEADLVLLEVERRMIELITPLPLLERSPVAGAYLIGVGPAEQGWKKWCSETCVTREAGLMAEAANSLVWLEHDGPPGPPAAGMPLFDRDGKLAGMNTARQEGTVQFAIPVELLRVWLDNIRQRPAGSSLSRPLSGLDQRLAVAPGLWPAGNTDADPATGVAAAGTVQGTQSAGNPAEAAAGGDPRAGLQELQDRIRQQVRVCAEFGFIPRDAGQYSELTRMAAVLSEAQALLAIPEDDPGTLTRNQWRGLDRIHQDAMDELTQAVSKVNRGQLEKVNRIALESQPELPASGAREAVVFVLTEINAQTSPPIDGQPTTVFELDVGLGHVICVVDPERHVFRQNTRWMLFGRWSEDEAMKIRTVDGETIMARQFELLLPGGPLR